MKETRHDEHRYRQSDLRVPHESILLRIVCTHGVEQVFIRVSPTWVPNEHKRPASACTAWLATAVPASRCTSIFQAIQVSAHSDTLNQPGRRAITSKPKTKNKNKATASVPVNHQRGRRNNYQTESIMCPPSPEIRRYFYSGRSSAHETPPAFDCPGNVRFLGHSHKR